MKKCTVCEQTKPLSEYHPHNKAKDGTINQCRVCRNKYVKEYRGMRGRKREQFMARLHRYGLTQQDYDSLYDLQGGRCAICGCTEGESIKGTFAIDHCHETGKVRGLLCGLCNSGIGKLKDSSELLRKAADYIDSGY